MSNYIGIPSSLNMGMYCSNVSELLFELKAVCFHHGEILNKGHYTSIFLKVIE